ncbi:DUF928 domain-containing protein [Limnospira fusiformis]|uniref:DUF928 domain-containing protein n=1 Tax=Limnospira fusiformis TaxID=54297 RepID=UPI001449F357|nr:DUF928 domain-containing protein [Limnospira fusiformis SAG 85.79]
MKLKLFAGPIGVVLGTVSLLAVSMTPPLIESVLGDDDQPPGRLVGGGTRSGNPNCRFDQTPLMAIAPSRSIGLTAQASPRLYFYLPAMETVQTAEFVLIDNTNDTVIYEETLKIGGKAGIMGVTIPSHSTQNIKTNNNYKWYFSIVCNPDNRSEDIIVEGGIRWAEIDPALASQINQASPLEKVDLYLKAGLWFDAMSTLAELRSHGNPDPAVSEAWSKLLESADLGVLVQEPVITE